MDWTLTDHAQAGRVLWEARWMLSSLDHPAFGLAVCSVDHGRSGLDHILFGSFPDEARFRTYYPGQPAGALPADPHGALVRISSVLDSLPPALTATHAAGHLRTAVRLCRSGLVNSGDCA